MLFRSKLYTDGSILSQIAVCLGGRVAEQLIFNNISTGASDDIEKASNLIYQYCCVWGMNKKIGPINPSCMGKVGENLSDEMFKECAVIMQHVEQFVAKSLKRYKRYVEAIAKDLLANETINYDRILELVPKKLENTLEITY